MKKKIKIEISPKNLLEALLKQQAMTLTGNYVLELEVENVITPNKSLTPDDYYRFEELIKEYGINLKDMREIMMLSQVWWKVGPFCTDQELMEEYLLKKGEFKESIYSGRLISMVLNALSACKNPVTDFYHRIKSTDPRDYGTSLDYLTKIYLE